MTVIPRILTQDHISQDALNAIFNAGNNPVACANYGDGSHCNEESIARKLNLWGPRGKKALFEPSPLTCTVFYVDGVPAALLNLGVTGTPPTVIDRTTIEPGKVAEISGLIVQDKFQNPVHPEIVNATKSLMERITDTDYYSEFYSKVFVTFSPSHPYQKDFLAQADATALTPSNIELVLVANSLHPERLKFDSDGNLLECVNWDKSASQVSHDGWHDSSPCIEFTQKIGMVFGSDITD